MATDERISSFSSSNDYSKYGIKDEPKQTTTTALGKTKTFARLYKQEWIFLAVSFINILTGIGLTLYRLVVVINEDPQSSDFTFILLLLINSAFCVFYVIHGVLRERNFELFALIAAIVVVALYCILEYFTFNISGRTAVKLARVIVVIIMAPPNIILAYLVSKKFGYLEFRIVGASETLQRLYREAGIFSCLLKFDLQAACSIVVLALNEGMYVSDLETATTAIGIPFSLLWTLLGWITLRNEVKPCAVLFALLGLVKPAYYLFKIYKLYHNLQEDEIGSDDTIVYSLIAAVSVGMLVWLFLMVELVFVYRNFGKGLKEIFRHSNAHPVVTERTGLLSSTNKDNYNTILE